MKTKAQTNTSQFCCKVKNYFGFSFSWYSLFNWQKDRNSKIILPTPYHPIIYNLDAYLPSFLNIFSIIFFHLIHVREQFTMSIKLDLDNSMKITSRISVGNVSIVCLDQNWITECTLLYFSSPMPKHIKNFLCLLMIIENHCFVFS